MRPMTLEQARKQGGVQPGAPIGTAQTRFYWYSWNFDSSIAAGGTDSRTVRIENPFCVTALCGTAFLNAALSSSVILTPLARLTDASSSNNTMPALDMVTVNIQTNTTPWGNAPCRFSSIFGREGLPHYPIMCPVVQTNDSIQITLTNNSAVGIRAQIDMFGYFMANN